MSEKVLEFLDMFLQHVCGNESPFGGKQMIMAMDPLQTTTFIQEINMKEIKKQIKGLDDEKKLTSGYYHSDLITAPNWYYCVLNVNIRSKDKKWSDFLSRARRSELTEEDFIWFQESSGSAIPLILKIKWLLINHILYSLSDCCTDEDNKSYYKFQSRLKNGWVLKEHFDVYKSIESIIKFSKSEESKVNFSNIINIAEVTMLATENVTIDYGNTFDDELEFSNIDRLHDVIFQCSISGWKKKYPGLLPSEYTKKWNELGHKESVYNILKEIRSCIAINDPNCSGINMTNSIECKAKDTFAIIKSQKEISTNFDDEDAKYYSDMANKKNKEKNNLRIAKGSIVISKSNTELYIHSNQRLKVIKETNGSLLVEPLYNNGLISVPRLIPKVLKEFKIPGRGSHSNKTIIVKRRTYPIMSNSALKVQTVLGIQLDAALFDNSRGVSEGETYIAAGRLPLPATFGLVHFPKSLNDLNEKYFVCNPVSKTLDTYLNNEKINRNCSIIPINFNFNYNGIITHKVRKF